MHDTAARVTPQESVVQARWASFKFGLAWFPKATSEAEAPALPLCQLPSAPAPAPATLQPPAGRAHFQGSFEPFQPFLPPSYLPTTNFNPHHASNQRPYYSWFATPSNFLFSSLQHLICTIHPLFLQPCDRSPRAPGTFLPVSRLDYFNNHRHHVCRGGFDRLLRRGA